MGYVEQAYALQNNFTTAAVKNKAGKYVAPTLDVDVGGRRGRSTVPDDLRFSTINAPGAQTYPITAVTFLLVYAGHVQGRASSRTTAKLVKSWLDYALGDGQKVAPELQYAPLPDSIKQKAQAKVDALSVQRLALIRAAASDAWKPGAFTAPAAAARSSSGRRAARAARPRC